MSAAKISQSHDNWVRKNGCKILDHERIYWSRCGWKEVLGYWSENCWRVISKIVEDWKPLISLLMNSISSDTSKWSDHGKKWLKFQKTFTLHLNDSCCKSSWFVYVKLNKILIWQTDEHGIVFKHFEAINKLDIY